MKLRLLFVIATLCAAARATAQQVPARADTTTQDTARRIAAGTAFYRSVLVPGWGQFSAGAPKRAYTFIALQGTSYFMLAKTLMKLGDANDLSREREAAARDSLDALMARDTVARRQFSDSTVYEATIDSTTLVRRTRGLVVSRKQQRQDWITYTLALTLASGVDAFVAAHLQNFPARVDAEPRTDGGLELSVAIPARRKR